MKNGHELAALVNLKPQVNDPSDELDSYMFQTVGHQVIGLYQECLNVPLFRSEISGTSLSTASDYIPTQQDEVEDLYQLLKQVKEQTNVQGVSVGAILSNYQRVRVENVCIRLGLTPLAYLWQRNQTELMSEMIDYGLHSVLIKVASLGLTEHHLLKSLQEMQPVFLSLNAKYESHVCGEGGEYETLTLDAPFFKKRIVIDEAETIIHSNDAFAIVAYSKITKAHVEDKPNHDAALEKLKLPLAPSLLDSLQYQQAFESSLCPALQLAQVPEPTLLFEENVVEKGPFVAISGVSFPGPFENLEQEVAAVMDKIQNILKSKNLSWENVLMMHLFVRDMSRFAAINKVYGSYFSHKPPSRVTVQIDLAGTCHLQADCFAYKDCEKIDVMHVQGISYWAPANIGPYSQVKAAAGQVHVAGQIGLIPHSMDFPKEANELNQCIKEIEVSLENLKQIVKAWDLSIDQHCLGLVCYTSHPSFNAMAKMAWNVYSKKTLIPATFVTVPCLPRNAKVEWGATLIQSKDAVIREGIHGHVDSGLEKVLDNVHISIAKGEFFSVSMASISFNGPVNVEMIQKAVQLALNDYKERQALLHRVFFSKPLTKSWLASAFYKHQDAAINLVPVVSIGEYHLSIYSLWV